MALDRYPTFLILESDVTLRNRVGIVENENGRFEANIVLVKVLPVLLFVPFKSHGSPRLEENTILAPGCQYICMYSSYILFYLIKKRLHLGRA
jgi:hypothetical protein